MLPFSVNNVLPMLFWIKNVFINVSHISCLIDTGYFLSHLSCGNTVSQQCRSPTIENFPFTQQIRNSVLAVKMVTAKSGW